MGLWYGVGPAAAVSCGAVPRVLPGLVVMSDGPLHTRVRHCVSFAMLSWPAAADLLRILGILSVGMVATLMFTAQITVVIREAVKTPVKEIAKAKPSPPFMNLHYIAWGTIFAASLAAIAVGGPQLAQQAALPYGLAVTLGGFLIGGCPGRGAVDTHSGGWRSLCVCGW